MRFKMGVAMRFIFTVFLFSFLGLAACAAPTPPSQTRAQNQKAAEATLVQFYEAAAKADFNSFIATFSKSAKFYGTDATELWPYEEFGPNIKKSFATNGGWDFDLKERHITLSQNGNVAWFAELTHFNNTDYLLRPTGVMQKEDGAWKIVQIVMSIPIPNLLYPAVLQGLQATDEGAEVETAKIDKVLNNLHEFAANADGDAYFDLYTDDAIFLGTDAGERWTKAQFKAYALPFFSQGKGWRYTPRERHIMLSPMGNMAWFDETLDSENYGTSRGTGVLVRSKAGWKISQYNLTFPIPNDLADEITAQIIKFEKSK
jgi:ketosteroid isomerase-like protein